MPGGMPGGSPPDPPPIPPPIGGIPIDGGGCDGAPEKGRGFEEPPAPPIPGAPMPGIPIPGAPIPGAPMPGAPMPGIPMPGAPMPGIAGPPILAPGYMGGYPEFVSKSGFELYIKFYCMPYIIGARLLPRGVARNSFGKSTISFGMPSPRTNSATSSVKLLQL